MNLPAGGTTEHKPSPKKAQLIHALVEHEQLTPHHGHPAVIGELLVSIFQTIPLPQQHRQLVVWLDPSYSFILVQICNDGIQFVVEECDIESC